uniref:CoA transferase n=1 Tax=Caballeronia sp. LjRoot34 TaxID=3342325 RepID=UPI003F4FC6F3
MGRVRRFPEKFRSGLAHPIEAPELLKAPRFSSRAARIENQEELIKVLGSFFTTRNREEWCALRPMMFPTPRLRRKRSTRRPAAEASRVACRNGASGHGAFSDSPLACDFRW